MPRRHAATTPEMMPITIENTVPAITIGIVFTSGCLMSSHTGRLSLVDVPRSPWASRWR